MATKYLRKIILEELQEVLKEDQAAFTQTGRDVVGLGSGSQVGGYADKLTAAQKAEAQKLVDASQNRLTFEKAAQEVAAKAMGTGAIESEKGRSDLAIITRGGSPKIAILQKVLASKGYDVGTPKGQPHDGKPGPFLYKAISKATGTPVKTVALEFSKNKNYYANYYATSLQSKPQTAVAKTQPGVSAGQAGMSVVPPAPPVATDNLVTTRKEEEPKPVGPTAEEKAALTKKAREEREAETKVRRSLKAQGFEESITREIRKLLRSI